MGEGPSSRSGRRLADAFPAFRPGHPAYPWLVLVATSAATFMATLDSTIVNVALNKITVAFGVSTETSEWVITAYMLAFGVILPVSGWLADHVGYKRIFLLGLALFTLSSLAASCSWSIGSLIFFRVIQAIGGGLVQPLGMAIITLEFSPQKRGLALGFWGIAIAASISLGPPLGGYLIDNYSWHSIFDINVPIGLVSIAFGAIIMREHKGNDTRSFDIVGLVTMAIFLCGLNLGLADGNAAWNTDGWTSQFILSCFGLSILGFVAFIAMELSCKAPLVELRLFMIRSFSLAVLVLFLFGFGMFGATFLLPLYLQQALGYSPFSAGMVCLPMGLLTAIASPLSGAVSDRIGPKAPLMLGLLGMAMSMYLNSFLTLETETARIMFPLCLRGFSMGFVLTPLTSIAVSQVPQAKLAQASALTNEARQVGGSVGIAVFGSLLAHQAKLHLSGLGQGLDPYSAAFNEAMRRLGSFAMRVSGSGSAISTQRGRSLLMLRVGKTSFVDSVCDVFAIASLILAIAIVPVLFIGKVRGKRGQKGIPSNVRD